MGKASKYVYLDTNIWIELERARSENDSSRQQVFEHVLSQVKKGLLCLPLSFTHCLEMVKHGDAKKRRRLWSFATSLSGCCAMLNAPKLLPLLIEEAVHKVFCIKLDRKPVEVFTRSGLFGLDFIKGQFPLTELIMTTEKGWNHFWLDMPDEIHEQLFEGLHIREEAFIQRRNELKNTSREYSNALRKRAYIAGLFLDMQEHYMKFMDRLGKNNLDIESLTIEDRIRLVTEVPTLDVEVSLATQHLQQWDRPESINDARDISHLCMAIPFCDVVITERYWVDKIQREKLDKKYRTQVSNDISFLLKL